MVHLRNSFYDDLAYHRPEHALQLHDKLGILALETVLPNELNKIREMPFGLQDLTSVVRLD